MSAALLILTLAVLGTGAAPGAPAVCTGSEQLERTRHHMGTLLRIRAAGVDRPCAAAALEAAFEEVARLERVLSSWTPDSEIGVLNAAGAGARVELSPELAELLREADTWVAATGGAFDPAVGGLIDAWQLRGAGRIPSEVERAAALEASGWSRLSWSSERALIRGPAGWWLDTGAFGKGAAIRSAAAVLRAHGVSEATLDFGGQLLTLGVDTVAVADPMQRSEVAAWLVVRGASVSTTSASERFIEAAGARYGHVLDPRTGEAVAAWGSVTVVADDALAADAVSTALFVMGPEAALAWASDRQDVGVLVLRPDGDRVRADWNAALQDRLIQPIRGDVGK